MVGSSIISGATLTAPRTIAITPTKSKDHPWDEVKRVCRDYVLTAIKTMADVRTASDTLRFIYYSGVYAERDQSKTPRAMPEMLLMRVSFHLRGQHWLTSTAGSSGE
jgi:hypothetical protein